MDKEIDLFSGLEWDKSDEAARDRADHYGLLSAWRQFRLGQARPHLTHVVLAHLLHLESRAIQVPVLPLELGGSRVVLGIIFAADWQPGYEKVLEFVYPRHRVLIKQSEVSEPPIQDIIREYVKLNLIWLIHEHMHTFLEISREDAAALFLYLDGNDGRLEVLVLYFSQKLFLPQLIDSEYIANTSY